MLAAALSISSCSSSSSSPKNSPAGSAGGANSQSVKPASGAPIQLGMINQENTPAGSFPEVREGAQAAVSYINASLGGVKGKPLKLTPCITDGSPASGANCSRQLISDNVVAVIGGEDFSTSGSIPPLAKAKIPYVGGIPILPAESTSPISFQFSGGSSGAFSAMDKFIATNLKAKKVSIISTDVPAGQAAANIFGKAILAKVGITDVKIVLTKPDAADFTAAVQQLAANKPDAILVLFSSPGCSRIMQAIGSLGVKAATFYAGSCLTKSEVTAGGAGAEGAYFNSDNMLFSGDDPQVVTWRAQMAKYQSKAVLSAYSQNGFQSVMNLYQALLKGPATPTSASIITTFEAAVDVPSFMGHPYTCNHKIVPGNPAICSSAQRIIQYKGGKFVDTLGAWLDGASLVG